MTQTKRYLVAKRHDGRYVGFIETFSTTSPTYMDTPFEAKLIEPSCQHEFINPFPATYYFENSDRMRHWLKGCKMVSVIETRTINEV